LELGQLYHGSSSALSTPKALCLIRQEMDDTGPLYNVRMKRGQGYNSYIQEPRIDNAVWINEIVGNDARLNSVGASGAEPDAAESSSSPNTLGPVPASAPQTWHDVLGAFARIKSAEDQSEPRRSKSLPYRLKLVSGASNNQTVTFSSKQVRSKMELDKAMGFKASAAIKATSLGPSVEAGSNLATQDDLNANDVNFLVHVKVVNESIDRKEEWAFNRVASLDEILNSDKVKDATDPEHARSIEFTRIYGDSFISDFVVGGEIYAWVGIRTQDRKRVKELGALASAKLTPIAAPVQASGEVKTEMKDSRVFEESTTSIRIQWRGGGEIKNDDFPWDLDNLVQIASAFPSMVAAAPAKIRAVLTPYTALKSFQEARMGPASIPLPLSYDHCTIYTSTLYEDFMAFESLCKSLNDMIKDPSRYRCRETKKKEVVTSAEDSAKQKAPGPRSRTFYLEERSRTFSIETHQLPGSLVALNDLRTIVGAQPAMGKAAAMDSDPYQLSMMRLLCRSSMVYIQERAAELVVDPAKAITKIIADQPHFSRASYPCPGIIQSILPVPKFSGNNYRGYVEIQDLRIPDYILDNPDDYWWDIVGEYLHKYGSYEYFAIGNFDLGDEEFPQKIAIQGFQSRWRRNIIRKIRDCEHSIAGIGLQYNSRPKLPTKLRTGEDTFVGRTLNNKEKQVATCTMLAGRRPEDSLWQEVHAESHVPPINLIRGYFQPGAGHILGLDFYSVDTTSGGAEKKEPQPVLERSRWDTENGIDHNNLPRDTIDDFYAPGGDTEDEKTSDVNWMFAGLVGAFERVGPLKRGRVLARVAIIWKRRTR
jgi:hypothetical protein